MLSNQVLAKARYKLSLASSFLSVFRLQAYTTSKMGSARPATSKLFEPLKIGRHTLSSRIVMAPLTRFRADEEHTQILPMVKEYYAQRACVPGSLLISEATFISAKASGYPHPPGIWTEDHIKAWKEVVDAVHAKGGVIFCQLWALGRTASKDNKDQEGTGDLVSASAIPEKEDGTVPKALSEEEIWSYVEDYADAAKKAVEGAGFDGVGEWRLGSALLSG